MDDDALNALDELDHLGVKEILDADSRPTFIIDLDPDDDRPRDASLIHPIFSNAALRLHERLLDTITGQGPEVSPATQAATTYLDFKNWATGVTKFDDSKDVFPLSFSYSDLLWTGSTVRQRWRLISGNLLWRDSAPVADLSAGPPSEISTGGLKVERNSEKNEKIISTSSNTLVPQVKEPSLAESSTLSLAEQQKALKPFNYVRTSVGSSDDTGNSSKSKTSLSLTSPADKSVIDWTAEEPKGTLSEHLTFARTVDWGATPLGPMKIWTPEFRQVANLVMNNPQPAALFWGSELTMLYNYAYRMEVAGNKHPSLMGTGFSGPFSELWDSVAPVFNECARTGISVRRDNDYLTIERHGLMEETFFSWSFTPLYGSGDHILGFYNAPFETTQMTVSHRRLNTINKLGEKLSNSKSVKQVWKNIISGLEDNHFDIPFALLYSVGDSEDGDQSSISSGSTISMKSCSLEGTLGIPDGHFAAPKQLDLKRSREGFIPSFREAMRTREPTLLHTKDGSLPEALLEGVNWRGFGDPSREAIIFPVRPTNGDTVLAFLLVGVNPRRPYDEEYKAFTNMLNRQLATSLASVMLFEEEVRRSRDAAEAATLQQQQLTKELALQTSRMRRMTELSPLGMYLLSPDGIMDEANDRYFEMTGLSRENMYEFSWMDCVEESSMSIVQGAWQCLTGDRLPWSGEVQFKKTTASPIHSLEGEDIDYWVLASAQPELAPDGTIMSVMGSITDISHLKWAQGLQNRRLQEAEETRRQQNEFIDITSHEMRNPLSAILQCADDISSALDRHRATKTTPTLAIIEECVDAAHTISLCVQHQKSIVDDILTISKLDSNLLLITPIPTQPLAVVKRAVKMFDAELQAKDIKVVFNEHSSVQALYLDWATLDPSRVLQILINLMTNAIKFTAGCEERIITVTVGASLEPPLEAFNTQDFQYIPPRTATNNIAGGDDWGQGEIVYLRFKVQDTGCGLTREEKDVLFERFKQASPRTHAQYGGSGLGLFISRQLAELHGGQIGVASQADVGSTFGFFITAKRSDAPTEATSPAELPIAQEQAEADSLYQRITPLRQDIASSSPTAGLIASKMGCTLNPKDLSILVVEDNQINQKVLVNQLKKLGSTVSAANDGLEALAFLEQTKYRVEDGKYLSVILMDLEMPNMDGLTCVRHIRRMEAEGKLNGHIPVLAVTANVREEQVAVAKEAGMDDVVSKPFRIPELLKKVEMVLRADQATWGAK